MSHVYSLVCVDCGEVLDLGKAIKMNELGKEIPWQFGSWQDPQTGERHDQASLWEMVSRFLLVHRGHEIRVLPEQYLTGVDEEGLLDYLDDKKLILSRQPSPEPEQVADARAVPEDLAARLKKRFP